MAGTYRAYFDYELYATFVPPATSAAAVVDLSHVTHSSYLEDDVTSRNTEVVHMFEKLPEKYTHVDSLVLLTVSNVEIATLRLGTPQIGNVKSVELNLVHEPSSIIEGQVFNEIPYTTVSSGIPELNDRL